VKQVGITEGKTLFWIFLYLWVLVGLFAVYKSPVLNEQNIFYHQGFALINAGVLAKAMLTAEIFHVGDNPKDKPLIYPIAFQVSSVFIHIDNGLYPRRDPCGHVARQDSCQQHPPIGRGHLEGIFVVGVIMFIVFMPFFALREIGRDIGDDNVYELFFVRRTKYVPLQP
jgi:hypothetical protein